MFASYPGRSTVRRATLVAAGAVLLSSGASVFTGVDAQASTSSVTAPAAGGTATASWTGTIPLGSAVAGIGLIAAGLVGRHRIRA